MSSSEKTRSGIGFIFTALCVFGFTMGLFTGWSREPVVGSLVSGLIGLASGCTLALLATKGDGNLQSSLTELVATKINTIASAVIALCLSTVSGTIVGINIRNNVFSILLHSPDPLTPVATTYSELPSGVITKLVMLQSVLDRAGQDPRENNFLIEHFAESLKKEVPISTDTSDLIKALNVLLELVQIIKANEEVLTEVERRGLKNVSPNSDIASYNETNALTKLCDSLHDYQIERLEALKKHMMSLDDLSLRTNERELDLLLELETIDNPRKNNAAAASPPRMQ
jgi:hypothetical protein